MMCNSENFFLLSLFGFLSSSFIWIPLYFLMLGKFSFIILLTVSCNTAPYSMTLGNPIILICDLLMVSHNSGMGFPRVIQFFRISGFTFSNEVSSSYEILSSTSLTLLVRISIVVLICPIVFFMSNIWIWIYFTNCISFVMYSLNSCFHFISEECYHVLYKKFFFDRFSMSSCFNFVLK